MRRQSKTQPVLWAVIGLLLLHVALRSHNIAVQDVYIDEGFHTARAVRVWDFDEHPAHFSHGKLLLYYWLGLFEADAPHFLHTARLSMALFSLLTCATLYNLGKMLIDHRAGLLAMLVYAVLPYSLFYERMAMADPLASGLVVLLVWRSWVFARRPTLWQGAVVGVLMGMALLAKLTVGLAPFLPVSIALMLWPWRGDIRRQATTWAKRYVPPLLVAGLTAALIWIPVIAPVLWAEWQNTDASYVVVNDFNVASSSQSKPLSYLERLLPLIEDFTHQGLWWGVGIAGVGLLIGQYRQARWRFALGLPVLWALLLGLLPVLGAELVTASCFMPQMAPLALLCGVVFVGWWEALRPRAGRLALVGGVAAWMVGYGLPFNHTLLTAPEDLPLRSVNHIEYQNGILIAEAGIRQAAQHINALPPDTAPIYATWNACHLMFLYLERPITCLNLDTPFGEYSRRLPRELPPDGTGYIVFSDYQQRFFQWMNGVETQDIARYDRESDFPRDIEIWAIRWAVP